MPRAKAVRVPGTTKRARQVGAGLNAAAGPPTPPMPATVLRGATARLPPDAQAGAPRANHPPPRAVQRTAAEEAAFGVLKAVTHPPPVTVGRKGPAMAPRPSQPQSVGDGLQTTDLPARAHLFLQEPRTSVPVDGRPAPRATAGGAAARVAGSMRPSAVLLPATEAPPRAAISPPPFRAPPRDKRPVHGGFLPVKRRLYLFQLSSPLLKPLRRNMTHTLTHRVRVPPTMSTTTSTHSELVQCGRPATVRSGLLFCLPKAFSSSKIIPCASSITGAMLVETSTS